MDINTWREAMTVISFAVFAGVVWYALHPGNGKRFEEAANLPLSEDEPSPQPSPKGEGAVVGHVFAK